MIPERHELTGWLRSGSELQEIDEMVGLGKSTTGNTFELSEGKLQIYRPDGQQFVTYVELAQQKNKRNNEQNRQKPNCKTSSLDSKNGGINLEDL
jgi:hypothetical protein